MQRLNQRYKQLLDDTTLDFTRYIYQEINWGNRLILLKGSKGVGKTKGYGQIANMPESYVIADGIDVGFGNKIPLWLFGFLY